MTLYSLPVIVTTACEEVRLHVVIFSLFQPCYMFVISMGIMLTLI